MEQKPLIDISQIIEPAVPETGKEENKEDEFFKNKLARENKMNATIHICKRVLLVVSFIIIIIVILIRVYALVTPHCWQWLTEEQNTKIDEFFVHGTIGAIIAGYLGKYFKEKE
jgi:hypothetical protein